MSNEASDVRFWSSYRFFVDPRYCTLHVSSNQPEDRVEMRVPAAQWHIIESGFRKVVTAKSEMDVDVIPTCLRQEQLKVRAILDTDFEQAVRITKGEKQELSSVIERFDAAKKKQPLLYKEIALFRAKHRIDATTGGTLNWLQDPDVQKGVLLACQTNDEEFFKSLGRVLSTQVQKKRPPIELLFLNNWVAPEPPLAIFSDTALSDLCKCMAEHWGVISKQAITQRRNDYELENLGTLFASKSARGLDRAVGPILRHVRATGRKFPVQDNENQIQLSELLASRDPGGAC
jgi:hypothetical protein